MSRIKVVLADDQALVRSGVRAILEADDDIEVVAEAEDGVTAARLALAHDADVVLMDVQMPGSDGLEGLTRYQDDGGRAGVVMLTLYDLDEHVDRALRAGASGFLLKTASPAELTAAVRDAAAGRAVFASSVTDRLVRAYRALEPQRALSAAAGRPPAPFDELSIREREVLRAMCDGLSNAEIADLLFLSETTVKTYVTRMLAKLGVRDRVQAVVLAHRAGLHHLATPGMSSEG
ncbi:response regulator transcription factor [Nocardioides sp. L-11A]|uniref:response regulator n=1 Tax=Nocardioides sp. L-11A TaxID=3043848 RepID=UPI00249B4451|nr:response regulator transcription factor [Nocardioides sp. L-11A]